jgi:hypothetical protein
MGSLGVQLLLDATSNDVENPVFLPGTAVPIVLQGSSNYSQRSSRGGFPIHRCVLNLYPRLAAVAGCDTPGSIATIKFCQLGWSAVQTLRAVLYTCETSYDPAQNGQALEDGVARSKPLALSEDEVVELLAIGIRFDIDNLVKFALTELNFLLLLHEGSNDNSGITNSAWKLDCRRVMHFSQTVMYGEFGLVMGCEEWHSAVARETTGMVVIDGKDILPWQKQVRALTMNQIASLFFDPQGYASPSEPMKVNAKDFASRYRGMSGREVEALGLSGKAFGAHVSMSWFKAVMLWAKETSKREGQQLIREKLGRMFEPQNMTVEDQRAVARCASARSCQRLMQDLLSAMSDQLEKCEMLLNAHKKASTTIVHHLPGLEPREDSSRE